MSKLPSDNTKRGLSRLFARPTLGAALSLLIAVQAFALGLKAIDDRNADNAAILQNTKSEAIALAEYLQGRALEIRGLLSYADGSSAQSLAGKADIVISYPEAMAATAGSRLRNAADVAANLESSDKWLGLSANNDLIIIAQGINQTPMLALIDARTWLRAAPDAQAISLTSPQSASNLQIGTVAATFRDIRSGRSNAQIKDFSDGYRFAQACAAPSGSNLQLCNTRRVALYGIGDVLRWISYILLLIAPALALWGLFNHFAKARGGLDQAQQNEKEAKRLLETAMASANAGFWRWDSSTGKGEFDPRMLRLIGLDPGTLINFKTYIETVHPEDRDRVKQILETVGPSEKFSVVHRVQGTKPVRWVEITGRSEDAPEKAKTRMFSGIGMDVTIRKRSDDRMAAFQRHLRRSVESFSGPFAIWDGQKRLLYWNALFEETFELNRTLRRGMSYDTVMIAANALIRQEKEITSEAGARLVELKTGSWLKLIDRETPDGSYITIGFDESDAVALASQVKRLKLALTRLSQKASGSQAKIDKLTRELQIAEASARDASEAKTIFLQSISHELRTPLNAINGFSEMLACDMAEGLPAEKRKTYAQNIHNAGSRLLDIVTDILDVSRLASGADTLMISKIDPLDPVDAAIRLCERQANEEQVMLQLDVETDLPQIDADHKAIKRMVTSLISNALKFTPAGGDVTVSLGQTPTHIRIAVSDTGEGIPKADIPFISEPFLKGSSSNERYVEGLGLGLALVKATAEMHGGELEISSVEGEGTIASILLPISQSARLAEAS
ncbi:MAG: ATP-binding protein [Pseudomonadota bacterium]